MARSREGDKPRADRNASRPADGFREVDERMADELHGHAALTVDRFSNGKDDEHAIGDFPNGRERPGRHAQICGLM